MGQDNMDELQLFEDIIRGQEMRDEGIISFDASLRELEVELRARYVDKGFTDIPDEDMVAFSERANEHWPFHDEVATVTGRLEVVLQDEIEVVQALLNDIAVPNADGEQLVVDEDDEDLCYVNVVGAKLNFGDVVIDEVKDQDGKLVDIRVGYAFYHLSDKKEQTPIFAHPSSLDVHEYDTVTPIEARARLERTWPSQLETIDAILVMKESLTHRLMLIADTLNEELRDPAFRELVELYVNEELELNMMMPYMTSVREQIVCLEDIANDDSLWIKIKIDGTLTLFLTQPEVRFNSAAGELDQKPEAYMFGATYNDEYGSKPEMVSIPLVNMDRFMSTLASTSLAERALARMDEDIERDMSEMIAHTNTVSYAEIEHPVDTTPQFVQELEMIEEAFGRIQAMGDEYRMHTFTTFEDAKRDAQTLLEKMKEYLNGTMIHEGTHLIEAMGDGIEVANLRYNLKKDEEKNAYLYGVDPDSPTKNLHLGDKVLGSRAQLYATAATTVVSDEDSSIAFYTPRVILSVITSEKVAMTVSEDPVLAQIISREQAAIPVDTTSDIHFVALDQYHAVQDALKRAETTYGESAPFMSRLRQLGEATDNEDAHDFVAIDPTILSRIPVDLGRIVRRHRKSTEPAAAALESMLNDRSIISTSQVYAKSDDGRLRLDEEKSGKTEGWRVIDVKPHELGDEVMLFVMSRSDNAYRYIPMRTITEFQL